MHLEYSCPQKYVSKVPARLPSSTALGFQKPLFDAKIMTQSYEPVVVMEPKIIKRDISSGRVPTPSKRETEKSKRMS